MKGGPAVLSPPLADVVRHPLWIDATDAEIAAFTGAPVDVVRAERRELRRARALADDPPMPGDEHAPRSAAKAPQRAGLGPADVLGAWRSEGPLVHEPTGFSALDDATGGGPVYGSRWYVLGAPDAGKTAALVQIAHVYAERGIAVGLLAVDEEPTDVMTRLAQRVGFSRHACEVREEGALEVMARKLGALPIRFYDAAWTIEEAAADLAAFAKALDPDAQRPRAFLGVDSIQTVQCDAERLADRELSEVQAIGARVRAIRAMATEHRLIALATSEMSRAAYRSIKGNDRPDPLAAAKWSGAIEYSARVLLALRSVKGTPDAIQLEVAKNKHGRALVENESLYLEIDRATQTLREIEPPAAPDQSEDDETRAARADEKVAAMADKILGALVKANARGASLTSRADLASLVAGGNDIKARAVSRLIIEGRIEGGRGRPFAPHYGDKTDDAPTGPDRSGPVRAPMTDRSSSVPYRGGGRRTGQEGACEEGDCLPGHPTDLDGWSDEDEWLDGPEAFVDP